MTTRVRPTAALALSGVAVVASLLSAAPAAAASCRVVTVQNSGLGISLSPARTSVPYGGCVGFSDQFVGPQVTITVAGGYKVTLNFGESTGGKTNYAATVSGAHAVTADTGNSTAGGQITVGSQPARSPSPSPSRSPSAAPRPTPSTAGSQSAGPQVARTPRSHPGPGALAVPPGNPPTGPGTRPTPGVAPSVAGSPPGPLQTTTPAAVVATGPLEPPSGRAMGLPAALAALVLIGVGTAVVRVVLAEPAVDNRRSVGGTA
jgi:hypothetical protein